MSSRPVRAVVYGVGAMGPIVTRLLVEKGAELVGAAARSPHKVGRDLGEVAGLGAKLGVTVQDDGDAVMSAARADITVVAVSSYLTTMYDHFRACLKNGANLVTIEGESFYPWFTAPELADELDALARRNGVSIMGSRAGPVLDDASLRADGRRAARRLRSRALRVERRRLTLGRVIAPGELLGVTDTATLPTREGPAFTFEQTGCVFGGDSHDVNEWVVRGDPPELRLRNDRVPTRVATCTQVVNRVPDVITARPGFVTVAELPRLRYRHFPLDSYIGRG